MREREREREWQRERWFGVRGRDTERRREIYRERIQTVEKKQIKFLWLA